MSNAEKRRQFLKAGSFAAVGGLVANLFSRDAIAQETSPNSPTPNSSSPPLPDSNFDGYSRFKPGRGNDPDSDYYIGKRMPGFRSADAGPAPFEAPDLEKLPWKMVKRSQGVPSGSDGSRARVSARIQNERLWLQRQHART